MFDLEPIGLSGSKVIIDTDLFYQIIVAIIIIILVILLIWMAFRLRKTGGSMAIKMHAATYEFLSKDKRMAVEEVVEEKSLHKRKEDESGQDKDYLNN